MMMRKMWVLMMVAAVLLLALACGGDSKDAKPAQNVDMEKARGQMRELQNEMASVRSQVNESIVELETQQLHLQARLKEIQARFEKLNARSTVLEQTLQGFDVKPADIIAQPASSERTGWPWYVKLLVIAVVVLLVIAFLRRHSRADDDEDDAEFEDDEVLEKSEMGEIRYPGSQPAPEEGGEKPHKD